MFEFLKYKPVPPPPAVLLYNIVCAVAVGSVAIAENVSVSSTTTLPVPLAFNIRSSSDLVAVTTLSMIDTASLAIEVVAVMLPVTANVVPSNVKFASPCIALAPVTVVT